MSGRKWLIVLLMLTIATLAVVSLNWLVRHIEFYQQQVDSGESERARRNPLLAAERFLERAGVAATSVFGRDLLYALPPPADSLIISDLGIQLSQPRQRQLENWLRNGGHLIASLSASRDIDDEHLLKRRFAVEAISVANAASDPAEPVQPSFSSQRQALQISFDPHQRLRFDDTRVSPEVILEDTLGIYLLQFQLDAGRLTLVSDLDFLVNRNIGRHDHAHLLWLLTRQSQHAWLMANNSSPSLWALAWRYNPYLVSSLVLSALLIFAALWQRFGPLRVDSSSARRNIVEHVRAVARFHGKTDHGNALLASVRQSLRQRCMRRHPHLKTLEHDQWAAWLARHTGLAERDIALALDPAAVERAELIKVVRVLQRIKQRI